MANITKRYWIGNTGNNTDTSHWSATSGGLGGETFPVITDDIYVDENSFTEDGIIKLVSDFECKNLEIDPTYNVKIAAGDNWCMTSTDGITWTPREVPYKKWNSVIYANSLFVAVGGNSIMTSPDGIIWTERVSPNSRTYSSIAYGNGIFVATIYNSYNTFNVITSTDGIVWTEREAPHGDWESIAYGNGVFVAIAYSGDNTVMTSSDGIDWSGVYVLKRWKRIIYGNGVFVAISPYSLSIKCWTSTDGVIWTNRTISGRGWQEITYGNGVFVTFHALSATNNRIATSSDGILWTISTLQYNDWNAIGYGNGLFVIVASHDLNTLATSPDGINWTIQTTDQAESNWWTSIAYGNGIFVILANSGNGRDFNFITNNVQINDKVTLNPYIGFWLGSDTIPIGGSEITIDIHPEIGEYFGVDGMGSVSNNTYKLLHNLTVNNSIQFYSNFDTDGYNIYGLSEIGFYAGSRDVEVWLRDSTLSTETYNESWSRTGVNKTICNAEDSTINLFNEMGFWGTTSSNYGNIIATGDSLYIESNGSDESDLMIIHNLTVDITKIAGDIYFGGYFEIENLIITSLSGVDNYAYLTGDNSPPNVYGKVFAGNITLSNLRIYAMYAEGNIPWDATNNCIDASDPVHYYDENVNIEFTKFRELVFISENINIFMVHPLNIFTKYFTADNSGGTISFVPVGDSQIILDSVNLKRVVTNIVDNNIPVKEFLVGNTDEDKEIFFRVDTQNIQLMTEFETFANPLAIVTKLQRGSMVKCFVAIGDDDFYELDGNATKGVSIVKIHSQNRNDIETPPIAREVRISWRDSSKQLCRLTQGEIVFLPTTMSYTE